MTHILSIDAPMATNWKPKIQQSCEHLHFQWQWNSFTNQKRNVCVDCGLTINDPPRPPSFLPFSVCDVWFGGCAFPE
jgi:hypothetical protein